MSKKLIGRLNKTQDYSITSVRRGSVWDSVDICTCDNCGRSIVNLAFIRGLTDSKDYIVGLDCAATLSGIRDTFELMNFEEDIKIGSRVRTSLKGKFKKLNSNAKVTLVFYTSVTDKNYWKEVGAGGYRLYVSFKEGDIGTMEKYESFCKKDWENYVFPAIMDLQEEFINVF